VSFEMNDFRTKVIVNFNFLNLILLSSTGLGLLYFTPFLGNLVRDIASDMGYGSAKLFYFVVADFEFYSASAAMLLLVFSLILLTSSIGLLKEQKWGMLLNKIAWSLTLIIFPIGTLFGAYALWITIKKERV
jgi:hypothetical protein